MAGRNNAQLLIFTNRLAAMIKSHLPLLLVMENLASEINNKKLQRIVEDVCDDITHGIDFGDALAEHPRIFDEIYTSIVSAGMGSGRLGESLQQLSEYLTIVNESRNKIRSALTYPVILMITFLAAFNLNVFWILPRFRDLFSSSGRELPVFTTMLLELGAWWQHNWYFVLGAVIFSFLLFAIMKMTESGSFFIDKQLLRLPIIGRLSRMSSMGRMLRTLSVQLENDVDILKAIKLAGRASGNIYINYLTLEIRDDVKRGVSLTDSFQKQQLFTGLVVQMVASGEATGNLAFLLMSAANYYDDILNYNVERWISLINPILTILVGIAIAGLLVATFLPVFDMGNIAT